MKEELDGLKKDLAGKSEEFVAQAMKDMDAKFQKELDAKMEAGAKAEALAALEKKYDEGVKAIQDHLDKLDVKMQSRKSDSAPKGSNPFEQKMAEFIKANSEEITKFRGKKAYEPEAMKAVGDMTTANLTGDQYRDYSYNVIGVLPRLVHVADVIGADINIGGGTYTFPSAAAGEGAVASQTEGAAKGQVDSDFTHTDVTTDFLAGFARYSKKMRNNLAYLESFLPRELRRKYMIAEDTLFEGLIAAAATASSQIITGKNKVEMIMRDIAVLEGADVAPNVIAMTPADWWNILETEKSTGAGYGLPGVVTFDNGVLRFNGIPVVKANWVTANEYFVGDFSEVNRVVTEGLSLEFSESDGNNFTTNNITARIEAQIGLAIHRASSIILGDFTAT